jgi:hypothetical protein
MDVPNFERAEYVSPYAADREVLAPEAPQSVDKLAFSRAVAYGLVAAVLGSLIYGLVGLWIHIGFISILVGGMVGTAMMNGSGGLGGRRYQVTAVALTYFAVSLANVFDGLWFESRNGTGMAALVAHHVVAIVILVLISPIYLVFASLGNGLLGLLILFFGMQQAWRIAKGGPGYMHFKRYDPNKPLGLR